MWPGLRHRPHWEVMFEQTFGRGEGGSCENNVKTPLACGGGGIKAAMCWQSIREASASPEQSE